MISRKYHAIAFVSILVMLLLLGLHLLGFSLLGSGGGQASSAAAAAASAALARNATTTTSSSSLLTPSGASSNSVYRHPIVYDKLTGATNNQINEVLGTSTKSTADQYPIDHYQQQQQQQQQQSQQLRNPFDQFANQDVVVDPFASMPGRQAFPPPPPPHGLGGPTSLRPPPPMMPPPPPPHHRQLVPSHNLAHHQHHPHHQHHQHHMMTTQAPQQQQQQDSLPSASSVNNNGAARPQANASNSAAQYYPNNQQQQQLVYYTPPIFTYSNINNNNNNNYDLAQQQQQPQVPPLGVPEVPLSVDEYNARQARLRQMNQQLSSNEQQQQQQPIKGDKQQVNLLAEPEAQKRFKEQMLDRQLLFGGEPAPVQQQQQLQQHTNYEHPGGYFTGPQTLTDSNNNNNIPSNFTSAAYYPDPALYGRLTAAQQPQQAFRPPYAHQISDLQQQAALKQMAPQNRIMAPPPPPPQVQRPQTAERQTIQSLQLRQSPTPPSSGGPQAATSIVRAGQPPPTRLTPTQDAQPTCARQQQQSMTVALQTSLELANSTSQLPALFCNEDTDYPTSDIMRALETYAAERSVELILPQPLVQMLTTSTSSSGGSGNNNNQKMAELQRQLSLDSLQANINAQTATSDELGTSVAGLFPSSSYEPLCKAVTWMAQPRRAKTVLGQWKVIVNLPGHKYRGIAISQMVRIEECTRPNSECSSSSSSLSAPSQAPGSGTVTAAAATKPSLSTGAPGSLARTRCLQIYENQRLLAWSNQQGLHFDIFRMPSACSCHNRRF